MFTGSEAEVGQPRPAPRPDNPGPEGGGAVQRQEAVLCGRQGEAEVDQRGRDLPSQDVGSVDPHQRSERGEDEVDTAEQGLQGAGVVTIKVLKGESPTFKE